MKRLFTFAVVVGLLLSLQVPLVGAQGPDETSEPTIHTVLEGETAQSIADDYGVTVADLLAANELESEDQIEVGMDLVIPLAGGVTNDLGDEPADQPADEPTDQPADEPMNAPADEPADEPQEDPADQPVDETNQPADDLTEEVAPPAVRDEAAGEVVESDIGTLGSFNPGTGVSKIAVMNIDSGGPVSFGICLLGQTGVDDCTTLAAEGPLNYRGTSYYDLATQSLLFGSGWIGSAVIEADREVFAAVDNSYSGGTYTGGDGFNGEAYEAPEAHTDIFLPYATNLGIYRFSRVTIQTTRTSGTTNVTLSYRDQNGNDATCSNPTSLPVEAGRSASIEPVFNCGGNTANGSVRITTTSDPVVVVFDGSWGEQAGWKTAYSGIPATKASNTLYYVNTFRRVPDNNWVQWSNIFVGNTATSPVRARISLYNTGAATPSMQFEADIPALSAREFNTRFGGTGGVPSSDAFKALGNLFAGTAIVEKISGPDNALVGVAHNFWGTFFFGGSTYTAFSAGDAADTLFVPFSARKQPGGSWTQWDKVSFMNITGSSVPVSVKYYDGNGNVALDLTGSVGAINVPNLSVDSINTRYGCDSGACNDSHLSALGNSFEGGIVIEGPIGSKLISIMNTLYPSRLNTFNAKAKNR